MYRPLLTGALGVAVVAAMSTLALAQKPGAHVLEEPVCTLDTGSTSITCENGSAAGLGNQAVIVSASVPAGCQVKPGTNDPPGHAQFTSEPIQPRGGRINFPTFTLSADCPPGLVPTIGTVVTYEIRRGDGTLVLTFQVTAS